MKKIEESIEIPVGTVITVLGKKVICVVDGVNKDGVPQTCNACSLYKLAVCEVLNCDSSRTDKHFTHFEYY